MTRPSWSRSSRWTAKPITAEAVAGSLPAVLVGRIKPGGGLSTASDWPGLICNFSVVATWLACQRPHGAATCRAAAHTDHLFLRGLPAFADDLPNRADRRVRAPGPRPGPIRKVMRSLPRRGPQHHRALGARCRALVFQSRAVGCPALVHGDEVAACLRRRGVRLRAAKRLDRGPQLPQVLGAVRAACQVRLQPGLAADRQGVLQVVGEQVDGLAADDDRAAEQRHRLSPPALAAPGPGGSGTGRGATAPAGWRR